VTADAGVDVIPRAIRNAADTTADGRNFLRHR
jgi:hypothetical protein